MKRHEWGPQFSEKLTAPVPPNRLTDVVVTLAGVDPTSGAVSFVVPPYDPATHNAPERIFVLAVPSGSGLPTDPTAAATDTSHPISGVDVPHNPAGQTVTVPRPYAMQAGVEHAGLSILRFDDPEPPVTTEPSTTPPATSEPTTAAPAATPTATS